MPTVRSIANDIRDLFGDTRVPRAKTRERLEELQELIESLLDALDAHDGPDDDPSFGNGF